MQPSSSSSTLRYILHISLMALVLVQCRPKETYAPMAFPGKPGVPSSIQEQHDSLVSGLRALTTYGDSTARAAIKLLELVEHHFGEEEEYVLPPLGLLPMLGAGQFPEGRERILDMVRRFRENHVHMVAEHQFAKVYSEELLAAAAVDNHPEALEFQKALLLHAREEEEVLFPAVELVGKYLEMAGKTNHE